MTPDELHDEVENTALELPQSRLTFPFGEDWEVYKVIDRVFMLMTRVTGVQQVTLKAEPRESQMLADEIDNVTPDYHRNKKHWLSVYPPAGKDTHVLPVEDLRELVVSSCLLVVAKMEKNKRPVDLYAYGEAHDNR
mgnify:FL=1